MPPAKRRTRRSFGAVRKLPSGRYQASYLDPHGTRVNAPETFTAKTDADAWLSVQRAAIETGSWRGKDERITVGEYATGWFASLKVKPRTRYNYRATYDRWILPTFGTTAMTAVTTAMVRKWLGIFPEGKPMARAQGYKVLARIFRDAAEDGVVSDSPVKVRGAADYRAKREGHALTVPEVLAIAEKMPKGRRLLVTMAAFCALRPGEVLALRRRDIDVSQRIVHVRETASAKYGGPEYIGPAKTAASIRAVHYPAALDDDVALQLEEFATDGSRGHLFPRKSDPAQPLAYSTFGTNFRDAATAAKIDDVRPHDLRHTGATLAAGTGATVRELMARLGHTSPAVAMRYQHAVRERDKTIADALGDAITAAGKSDEGADDDA